MLNLITRTLVVALIIALQSCASLVPLDRAQDLFSKGANIENKSVFDFNNFNAISPSSYYNLAYAEVKEALKQKGRLRKDSVLANAYALKALCEWKLKRYAKADSSANAALQLFRSYEKAGLYMPRDKAVMVAMEGLILTDQVNDELFNRKSQLNDDTEEAKQFFMTQIHNLEAEKSSKIEQAMLVLENAKAEVKPAVPAVETYFLMCQLSAMKVWSDGIDYLMNVLQEDGSMSFEEKAAVNQFIEKEQSTFLREKVKYLEMLKDQLPGKESNPTYLHWDKIL